MWLLLLVKVCGEGGGEIEGIYVFLCLRAVGVC